MTTKKNQRRTYVSLSFSCPPEMEAAINERTVALGFHSRSDYLRRLFERDLIAVGLYDPRDIEREAPPRIKRGRETPSPMKRGLSAAKAPSRITRGRRKRKPIEQGQ